jgi:CxxC-x17-CxxC domain-containing protein
VAFQDQTLTCSDCGQEFNWTSAEQEFYQKKGFENQPKRCPNCRQAKKQRMNGGGGGGGGHRDFGGQRQQFAITCSNCGKQDTVPFQPKGDRPVLCRDCFRNQK